jgi:hypothetical protein
METLLDLGFARFGVSLAQALALQADAALHHREGLEEADLG